MGTSAGAPHWISATPGQPSPPVSSMGVVNFSLRRHRLQTRKPETSAKTRARLRAPPRMGHSILKWAGGAAAHPRQKSLCGRAGQEAQSMHLSRSALQELPLEHGELPGACSPAVARINTNPNPNTRSCGRGRGQPGAMIAGSEARTVCSHHRPAKTRGCGSAPAPAFRGGAFASARPCSHSTLRRRKLFSSVKLNPVT